MVQALVNFVQKNPGLVTLLLAVCLLMAMNQQNTAGYSNSEKADKSAVNMSMNDAVNMGNMASNAANSNGASNAVANASSAPMDAEEVKKAVEMEQMNYAGCPTQTMVLNNADVHSNALDGGAVMVDASGNTLNAANGVAANMANVAANSNASMNSNVNAMLAANSGNANSGNSAQVYNAGGFTVPGVEPLGGADVSGFITDTRSFPPFPDDQLTSEDLLPKDRSDMFDQLHPTGQGPLDRNFLTSNFHIGVNTVGQTLRNANRQLRSDPPNPQVPVSPWNMTTISPDVNRRAFEVGEC